MGPQAAGNAVGEQVKPGVAARVPGLGSRDERFEAGCGDESDQMLEDIRAHADDLEAALAFCEGGSGY